MSVAERLAQSAERSATIRCGIPKSARHHRTIAAWQVKGLTDIVSVAVVNGANCRRHRGRRRGSAAAGAHPELSGYRSEGFRQEFPRAARNASGHGRPRPRGPERLRQSAGLPRLDRALSDRRGFASPIAASYQYGRRGTPTTEALQKALADARRSAVRRRRACALGTRGDFAPRCSRLCRPATISWSADSVYRPTRNFCDGMLTPLRRRDHAISIR